MYCVFLKVPNKTATKKQFRGILCNFATQNALFPLLGEYSGLLAEYWIPSAAAALISRYKGTTLPLRFSSASTKNFAFSTKKHKGHRRDSRPPPLSVPR